MPDLPPSPAPAARATSLWGSLKLQLAVIGAVLIAASVALTVGLTLRGVDQHSEQVALDLSLSQTRKMAKLISARVIELQLAQRAAAERLDLGRPLDERLAQAFLSEQASLASEFDSLYLARADGHMLAFRDSKGVGSPRIELADRDYFRQTIQQGRPIISQPILGRGSDEPVVVLTVPLRDASGRVVAVLGGGKRLATRGLMPELTAEDEFDPAMTIIVDAIGRVISHPDRQWILRDAALEPTLATGVAAWIAQGRPIEPSGLAKRYGEELVSSAGVPDAEWVVFRAASVASVLGGVKQAQQRALAIGVGVALGGGLLLLSATFLMLRPLQRLERCALDLMQGQPPDAALWPRADNEIGHLSRVLQQALQARAEADAAGHELLDRLQAMMAQAPIGIAFTRNRKFEAVSAHFHHVLGYPNGSLVGQPPRIIYTSDEFYESLGARVGTTFEANRVFDEEIEFLHRDGSRFWGRLQGRPVRWGDTTAGAIWTLEDVTTQRNERQTLAWASSHDTLTRLANRAEFERRLAAQCQDRRRSEPVSVLFIDLDRFKTVNDSAGHAAGDAVLVAVARVLEEQVRHGDTVARMGGDEFAVLLTSCDRSGAAVVAEKMRAAVEALRVPWAGAVVDVGASIGGVELDATLYDVAAVLTAADIACYAAKHEGRNRVRVHGAIGLQLVSG